MTVCIKMDKRPFQAPGLAHQQTNSRITKRTKREKTSCRTCGVDGTHRVLPDALLSSINQPLPFGIPLSFLLTRLTPLSRRRLRGATCLQSNSPRRSDRRSASSSSRAALEGFVSARIALFESPRATMDRGGCTRAMCRSQVPGHGKQAFGRC